MTGGAGECVRGPRVRQRTPDSRALVRRAVMSRSVMETQYPSVASTHALQPGSCLSVTHLSARLHTSRYVCLSVCKQICMSVCLSVCTPICQFFCLSITQCVCLSDCLSVCTPIGVSVCLSTICLPVYIPNFMSVCLTV